MTYEKEGPGEAEWEEAMLLTARSSVDQLSCLYAIPAEGQKRESLRTGVRDSYPLRIRGKSTPSKSSGRVVSTSKH